MSTPIADGICKKLLPDVKWKKEIVLSEIDCYFEGIESEVLPDGADTVKLCREHGARFGKLFLISYLKTVDYCVDEMFESYIWVKNLRLKPYGTKVDEDQFRDKFFYSAFGGKSFSSLNDEIEYCIENNDWAGESAKPISDDSSQRQNLMKNFCETYNSFVEKVIA